LVTRSFYGALDDWNQETGRGVLGEVFQGNIFGVRGKGKKRKKSCAMTWTAVEETAEDRAAQTRYPSINRPSSGVAAG
jgi:hypothetical protein